MAATAGDTDGMGVAVAMERPTEPLEPGSESSHSLRIRNTGAVVDQFEVDVVGQPSTWARIDKPTHNLLPGEEVTVQLTFVPPRTPGLREGPVPYAVRVMSQQDTAGSAIEEGTLHIGAFSEVAAELVPHTSTGRWRGGHQLALDNLGNHAHLVSIAAHDPDLKLTFEIVPANPTLEPGTATFVKIVAKPKDTFYRGANVTLPFEVWATPEGQEPIPLKGTMVQTAILPAWIVKAALIGAAGAIALVVLWFTVFRPTIESTAKAVAEDQTKELAEAITDASNQAAAAQQQAAAAQAAAAGGSEGGADGTGGNGSGEGSDSGDGEGTGEGSGTGNGGRDTGADGTDSTDPTETTTSVSLSPKSAVGFRVTTDVPTSGGFVDSRYVPGKKSTLWISDLLLQNPAGDTGTLRIQRGDDVLMVFGLENFRDLDYHFIQPVSFTNDAPVVVSVDCRNPTEPCTPSVYFAGRSIKQAKPAATEN